MIISSVVVTIVTKQIQAIKGAAARRSYRRSIVIVQMYSKGGSIFKHQSAAVAVQMRRVAW